MKRTIAILAALTLCAASSAYALYSVANEGLWPTECVRPKRRWNFLDFWRGCWEDGICEFT